MKGPSTVRQIVSADAVLGSAPRRVGRALLAVTAAAAAALCGCDRSRGAPPSSVILVTTTSTYDTGLLDTLIPLFEAETGLSVKVLAVGTGQALAMGARGEADLALVHAPDLEERYLAEGAFVNRRPVMRSDFVVVGPPHDPARVAGAPSAAEAFRRIAAAAAPFASRGDQSGTHQRERQVWRQAGIDPGSQYHGEYLHGEYLDVGQGMAATLMVASQKGAYALSDRATFLTLRDRLSLKVLLDGDPALANPYHVMEVNPQRFAAVHHAAARQLSDFLVSPRAQDLIGRFGADRYGQPLFRPGPPPGST